MHARRPRFLPLGAASALPATVRADETGLPVGGSVVGTTLGCLLDAAASFPAGAEVIGSGTVALAVAGATVLLIAGARTCRR
jgi:hypothetical protein